MRWSPSFADQTHWDWVRSSGPGGGGGFFSNDHEPSRGERGIQVNRRRGGLLWWSLLQALRHPSAARPKERTPTHSPPPTTSPRSGPSLSSSLRGRTYPAPVLEDLSISPRGPTPPLSRPRPESPGGFPRSVPPGRVPGLPVGQRGCSLGPPALEPQGGSRWPGPTSAWVIPCPLFQVRGPHSPGRTILGQLLEKTFAF